MTRATPIALIAMSLAMSVNAVPAFAFSERALTVGEREARHLLRLMDKDRNGQVSREEFMQFMSAEFDRLDRDRSGQLSPEELSHTAIHYGHKTSVSRR